MSRHLRKLTINDEIFLWRCEPHHVAVDGKVVRSVVVVAYLEGYKQSPLRVRFSDADNPADSSQPQWQVSFPEAGALWMPAPRGFSGKFLHFHQLNRPACIRQIILYFLQRDWGPANSKRPLEVRQGLLLIEEMNLPEGLNT